MLLDAAELFELDLARSIMVGDSLSDILAGKAAGVARLVHVATGHGQSERGSVIALNDKMSGKLEAIAGIGDLKLKEGRA